MKKYSKYKDSSIEWIGQIPEEWSIKRVKEIFKLERGKFTHRPRNDERMYNNGVYPFIQTGDVAKANKYVTTFKQTLNDDGIKVSRKFNKGTIVMTIAANIGDVAILDFDSYFPDSLVAFKTKFCTDYFYYLLYADKKALDNVKVTNTQDNLNLERLNGLEKIFPPLNEQTQIANYLDDKTTLIDKKIKLLKQKIKHYKTYRKTLINETVTKGLDRTVKLKDSGIDWIGEIPEHWEVKRLKDYFNLSKGVNSSKYNNDYVKDEANLGEYPVYSGQTENNGLMAMINSFEYNFNKKVMLVTTVGAKAMDLKIVQNKFTLSQNCALFISKKGIDTDFQYFYLTQLFREERKVIPTIMQPSLRIEDLKKYFILLPPIKEQQQIADFLDAKTNTIDNIVNNIETQIKTLKELRKTLINEVVTGKVKVTA